MTGDKRDLLDVLSAELAFSESGGYRHSEGDAWRPQFIFQDSPTCLEFNQNRPSTQCANCILTKLAPHNLRSKKTPCRYIPLNENGETLDSLLSQQFSRGDGIRGSEMVENKGRAAGTGKGGHDKCFQTFRTSAAREARYEPRTSNLTDDEVTMFEFCANQECHAPFDYRHGRLFRFHKDYAAGDAHASGNYGWGRAFDQHGRRKLCVSTGRIRKLYARDESGYCTRYTSDEPKCSVLHRRDSCPSPAICLKDQGSDVDSRFKRQGTARLCKDAALCFSED